MSRRNRRSKTRWYGKLALAKNGRAGNRVGASNEARVLEVLQIALEESVLPDWITSVRAGTSEEDAQGKDLVIDTDRGAIGLQVKSGMCSFIEFKRDPARSMIAVIMVKKSYPDWRVVKSVVEELEEIRGVL